MKLKIKDYVWHKTMLSREMFPNSDEPENRYPEVLEIIEFLDDKIRANIINENKEVIVSKSDVVPIANEGDRIKIIKESVHLGYKYNFKPNSILTVIERRFASIMAKDDENNCNYVVHQDYEIVSRP